MNFAEYILGPLVVSSVIVCIGIFFYRLKYIKDYGLILWGIVLLLNLIFPFLAFLIHVFLKANLTFDASLSIFSNILVLFSFAITLILFYHFKIIKGIIASCIYLIFIAIWLIEFSNKGIAEKDMFNYAFIFSKVLTVALSWLYLFELYLNPRYSYKKIPFFWLVLGWLISSTISSILNIPNITSVGFWSKVTLETITTLGDTCEAILCCIGFWKTKDWILKNQDNTWEQG